MLGQPPAAHVPKVLAAAGISLPDGEADQLAQRLVTSGGLPGGHFPAVVPDEIRPTWERRDLDAAAHRAAYTWLIKHSGWPWPELADAIYESCTHPDAWEPYPDTLATLAALKEKGVRTCVVSNIGWNPRPVLSAYGVADLVDDVLLSYEEGCQKPDPAIFRKACALLGATPARTLMVGDDRRADGGAEAVGIRTFFVDPVPVQQRPDGFAPLRVAAGVPGD